MCTVVCNDFLYATISDSPLPLWVGSLVPGLVGIERETFDPLSYVTTWPMGQK